MYNVKGPSKIVAKTRRGLVQNIEVKNKKSGGNNPVCNNNNNDNILNNNNEEMMVKGPKPVFQNVNKKLHQNGNYHHHDYDEQQVVTPQHEEIVNYVSNSWNCVCTELDLHVNSDGSSSPQSDNSVYYYEDDAVNLTDFKPFDLESWWGKRLYTYITNSVNTTTS